MAKEKGATVFDKLCHRVFAANGNGANYRSAPTGVYCGHCGTELEFYYCEERLYVIECHRCKTRALVEAGNAAQAAYKTFGYEVIVVDKDELLRALKYDRDQYDKGYKDALATVKVVRCEECYLSGKCVVEDVFNTARMPSSKMFCAAGKRIANTADRCVCCGDVIPEGRQVCPGCEGGEPTSKSD